MGLLFSVIVTEKTNILLRYLHQQWDKKVCHDVQETSRMSWWSFLGLCTM